MMYLVSKHNIKDNIKNTKNPESLSLSDEPELSFSWGHHYNITWIQGKNSRGSGV